MSEIKVGNQTTEFQTTKSVNFLTILAVIVGVILQAGDIILSAINELQPGWGVIAGVVLQVLAVIGRVLNSNKYIESRTRVKEADAVTNNGN